MSINKVFLALTCLKTLYSCSLLPIGFSQLNKLKWLDLKDNPLDQSLTGFVGNCLDDKQCRQCAKKVVAAMKTLIKAQERQRKKQLEEQKSNAFVLF